MRVSLTPEDVAGFVFWTRFPRPMLPRLRELDERGYRYYFHITMNGYGREFETRNPGREQAVAAFRAVSDAISSGRTHWRYDPVILSERLDCDFHQRNFEQIARTLKGATARCYFSFVDLYGKTRRNLVRLERAGGDRVRDPDREERWRIALRLRDIAGEFGITLFACCEDAVLAPGIAKARCVEPDLFGLADGDVKAAPTREQCGCVQSVDIGAYDTCRFGCVYCYATNSPEVAAKRSALHDPEAPALLKG